MICTDDSGATWKKYKTQLISSFRSKQAPYHACFELTPLCNFNCNMCYVHLTKSQLGTRKLMSGEQWNEFGRQAVKAGLVELSITGGEALTHPDFRQIYDALYRMGLLITLRTNGYLLTEELVEWFKTRKPHKIQVSFYGACDETYQKVCGVKDGFTVVSRNLERLKENGIPLRTTMTVTSENEAEVQQLWEWAKEHQIAFSPYFGLFQPFENTGRKNAHLRSLQNQTIKAADFSEQETDQAPVKEETFSAFRSCTLYGAQFTITWDGKMTPCTGVPYMWVDPFSEPLKDAFVHLNEKVEAFRRPKECWNCKFQSFCQSCPSSYRIENGVAKLQDSDCCDRARYRYQQALLKTAEAEKQNETET